MRKTPKTLRQQQPSRRFDRQQQKDRRRARMARKAAAKASR